MAVVRVAAMVVVRAAEVKEVDVVAVKEVEMAEVREAVMEEVVMVEDKKEVETAAEKEEAKVMAVTAGLRPRQQPLLSRKPKRLPQKLQRRQRPQRRRKRQRRGRGRLGLPHLRHDARHGNLGRGLSVATANCRRCQLQGLERERRGVEWRVDGALEQREGGHRVGGADGAHDHAGLRLLS